MSPEMEPFTVLLPAFIFSPWHFWNKDLKTTTGSAPLILILHATKMLVSYRIIRASTTNILDQHQKSSWFQILRKSSLEVPKLDWFSWCEYKLLGLEFEQLGWGKQFLCGADISVWLNANFGLRKDRGNRSTAPYPVFNALYEYT